LDYKSHLEHLRVGADPKVLSEIQQFHRLFRADNLEETPLPLTPTSEVNEAMMPDEAEAAVRVLRLEAPRKALSPPSTSKASSPVPPPSPKAPPPSSSFKFPEASKSLPGKPFSPPPPSATSPTLSAGIRDAGAPLWMTASVKTAPPVLPPPPTLGLTPPKPVPEELPESMKPKRAPSGTLKMKTIMWSKITPSAVVHGQGSESVWGELARQSTKLCLDFDMIDGMFAITPAQTSPALVESTHSQFARKRNVFVDLLTPKRSQNVTITLKQFKDLDALISDLHENNVGRFDVEVLRTLRSILPDSEEVRLLRCAFFLRLLDIPDYRLRIDCMDPAVGISSNHGEWSASFLQMLLQVELRQSHALRRLLLLLVNIGNYLNSSSTHGNAAGFKLSSLWQVIDHRATKGSSSLLHLLAKMDPALLSDLEQELPNINRASEVLSGGTQTLIAAINLGRANVLSVLPAIQLAQTNKTANRHIRDYLASVTLREHCHVELAETNKSLMELLKIQDDLALFFCENKGTFKIEECFKIFKILLVRLRQALQDYALLAFPHFP
ncbi:hypothetical protein OSTOST_06917, partial [Ostertagia ostertagi]